MHCFGMIRVGLASPQTSVANPRGNAAEIGRYLEEADCDVLIFPELALTGYTCGDLFQQSRLLDEAKRELRLIAEMQSPFGGVAIVGLPLAVGARLYNVAAVMQGGRLLGLVPKQHIPNYNEFYEQRWFSPPRGDEPPTVRFGDHEVPFGADLLFTCQNVNELTIGVEICEDLWVPVPPSCHQAAAGATLLVNLSASNESAGKADYRRQLVLNQSARCVAAYAFCSAGVRESTTDVVFGGHSLITESGTLLEEGNRFQREGVSIVRADVDVQRLAADRRQMTTFADAAAMPFRTVPFELPQRPSTDLLRRVPARPFVPTGDHRLKERCQEIFNIQVAGLAKRLEVVQPPNVQIGVSGGLDSTLALLVTIRAFDLLKLSRKQIIGTTMPGFGTTQRTYKNATALMEHLGVTLQEIDIRPFSKDIFDALKHAPFGIDTAGMTLEQFIDRLHEVPDENLHDLVFENVQARIRTLLLMNQGFVIGTGDLSELALGWATYNADHMSMYNPNCSIPKTLVRFLIQWVADHEFVGETREVLYSIVGTEISPELLPAGPNRPIQSTEDAIGPYEVHDFFLYHMIRFGFGPRKLLWLASRAEFDKSYKPEQLTRYLRTFYRRFFTNQYKRSCLPDGPKVGSISLSPRGDWRMPSDADYAAWIRELDNPSP